MTVLSSAALALLQSQHGVASAQQLKDCGVSRHQIDSLVQSANLVPVLKGVYRHPVATFDELSRCVAFCVAHPSGVISGPTAGRLWGFRKLPNDRRIHAIVPPRAQPVSVKWIIPYRTAAIHDDDRIRRPDGIVVTSRQRTALDLARSIDSNLGLLSVIEQAAVDGGLDQKALRAVAVDWRSGQRPWPSDTSASSLDASAAVAPTRIPRCFSAIDSSTRVSAAWFGSTTSIYRDTGRRDSTSPCLT